MVDRLAAVPPRVDDDPVPCGGDSLLGGHREAGREQRVSQILVVQCGEVREVALRRDQDMHRGLRVDVAEGQHVFVLEDTRCRDLSADNPAEKTRGHEWHGQFNP